MTVEEAVDDKAALPERVLQAAQHAGRMHGFSHRHTSYPMATRLAKLWVHSHMFSGYLADVRLFAHTCASLLLLRSCVRVADSTSRRAGDH